MKAVVTDGFGHEIYLTDERWQHIVDEHPVFLYYRDYAKLPFGNKAIVAIVRFGVHADGRPKNFVLTAYQIHRRRS